MAVSDIVIRGAREHNLRDLHLRLPRNKLICMTGVSGSGKSSLAFDTLYAEGQRRYVESLSSYARQFLGQMPKPEVDSVSGLAPSISIQQKSRSRNPRSTVGTITEIYDYLRVLYARVGQGVCANCERPITAQSVEAIIESISQLTDGTRFQILAPLIQQQKGEYRDLFEDLLKQGYLRARVDGTIVPLTDAPQLDRQMKHSIEVVIDRLTAGKTSRGRLAEAAETALKLSGGTLIAVADMRTKNQQTPMPGAVQQIDLAQQHTAQQQQTERLYSSDYACTHCGISYERPSPQLFSFNSPLGMCPNCNGLGTRFDFLPERLIPNETLSLARGAIALIGPLRKVGRWRRHIYEGVLRAIEQDFDLPSGSLAKTPWNELPAEVQRQFLYGMGDRNITFAWGHRGGTWKHGGTFAGVIPELLKSYRTARNPMRRRQLEKFMEFVLCTGCGGNRLNAQARHVRLTTDSLSYRSRGGPSDLSLPGLCALSIRDAAEFFESLELDKSGRIIAEEVLKEIRGRLGFLLRCGLDYLTLDRSAPTLSGGESQRIRLASQIGCGLVGVVYILDEPSIGLHPHDNALLLESLRDLRDQGNTVIVVEHDEETMRAADHLVDFGPGPGVRGGEIVAEGPLKKILAEPNSLTGQYLSGQLSIPVPDKRRKRSRKSVAVLGARRNNLKNIDVRFPLESFICVTGVSGSGKSSLVNDILWQVLNRDVNGGKGQPGKHRKVTGLQHLDKAIDIDQSPIGRTPRSNPATYVKLLDLIRQLFTQLPDSRVRGYKPGRFSFNVTGGRCEACQGYGSNKLEMDFLADIWVTCPVCEGRRFNHETLEVRYKRKNVAEILDMDVQEAIEHFRNVPKICRMLETLDSVGLDYLKLGQPSPTLSGGEAQRIKLARELGKRSTGRTIYLLDEPTTGLHFADIHKLLEVLHGFVDAGNTVLVIEHNLDVIKTADWIIDLGPDGGIGGGTIVAQGPPEEVAACPDSYTGAVLADVLPGIRRKSSRKRPAAKSSTKSSSAETSQTARARNEREITIRGAREHNLKGVDLTIPRDKMSVFCGPSGSGKSSLAMDTLYAEGQRRYVESLSAYARQFLGQMPKPRVEHIHGLSPAIAIEQKNTGQTPRSTIGTVTEIYDYLRILYARLGTPSCPECQVPIDTQTTDQVIEKLLRFPDGTKLLLLAPQEVSVGQKYETLWERVRSQGFLRVRIDGETCRLDDVPEMDRRSRHQVEIVVDRITIGPRKRSRIADSVEMAFDLGRGTLLAARIVDDRPETQWPIERFSLDFACPQCGRSFEELTPHNFSFNSPLGWCEACEGLGIEQGTNLSALIADPKRTLADGAIAAWPDPSANRMFQKLLAAISKRFGIPLDVPFEKLEPEQRRMVLYGTGEEWIAWDRGATLRFQYKGLYPAIEEASRVSYTYRQQLRGLVGEVPCSQCQGSRLRADAAAVRFHGRTLQQFCELPLEETLTALKSIRLSAADRKVAGDLLTEATSRLSFLVDVGLHYLSLSRSLPSLSGGETQRIRLAGQIGRALTGVLYVLDEPTIGLHPRDNDRLLKTLHRLRDLGNTLLLVEHDRDVLAAADRLYDFGPGAGRFGGTVVGQGTPKQLARQKNSLTGRFLSGRQEIPVPTTRRMQADDPGQKPPGEGWLELLGAKQNNLRDVDLRIPLGTLTCITGVSGSGKSSLIEETLAKAVAQKLHRAADNPAPYDELIGLEKINKLIVVDQRPLGNTPASNPATYTGLFDHIRDLFCRLPDSRIRGYRPARFSFNRSGGRCDDCEGNGQKRIEMHFLPDVWVECETCRGKRYNTETLAVKFRGRSIADVLAMSIGEAAELFDNIPKIRGYLATLCAIGLGYLTLGQSAPTLSGGEAQRVKLAAELARPQTGQTLYLLDEPTTGLHFDDIDKLLTVLNSLVERGNTVVVIEHNLDVIKTADWIIDLGPEAGHDGGRIVVEGTPEEVVVYAHAARPAANRSKKQPRRNVRGDSSFTAEGPFRSHTGEMLASVLVDATRSTRDLFDVSQAVKKQAGDLDLKQIGRDAKMPWQRDGRRWHSVERIGHNGRPGRWEGEALEWLVDRIEAVPGFRPADWNDRSVVELTGQRKKAGWFLHALTGDEWLLRLNFRVRRNTFRQDDLSEQLDLKPIDDLDELPIYGRVRRVKVRNLKGPWQEVSIVVHWLREIETPGFRAFLQTACESFLAEVNRDDLNIKDLTPWKVLGRKWHLSRKGFSSSKRVAWKTTVLDELFDLLIAVCPDGAIDWGNKQVVHFFRETTQPNNKSTAWATVCTKRRGGIDLSLFGPRGRFALGRIAEFGSERDIKPAPNGREAIRIRLTTGEQVASPALCTFLKEHFDEK